MVAGLAGLAALALLAAGCGSVTSGPSAGSQPTGPAALALNTAADAAGGTWATVPMGAASGADEFWQLFVLPDGSGRWSLQTPPDIATNGAIVLAVPSAAGGNNKAGGTRGAGGTAGTGGTGGTAGTGGTGETGEAGKALVAGVRPSLDLSFSPITSTADLGRSWTTSPPQSGLANLPDALAAAPDGRLLALGQDGGVTVTSGPGGAWSTLTTERALAGSLTGCGLTGLTAAAYAPAGTPLLAGTCDPPGQTAVLGYTGGAWHRVSPALPAALSGQRIRVLRLTRTSRGDVALLAAGTAPSVRLLAAWTSDGGQHWALSRVLQAGTAAVSASVGASGGLGVVLAGKRAEIITGPGSSWQPTPALPAGRTVMLALPSGGGTEALAADAGTLTVWRLAGSPAAWTKTQTIKVPIQYGSSS
jgi:hypothetical protein